LSANSAAYSTRAGKAILFPGTLSSEAAVSWGRELAAPSVPWARQEQRSACRVAECTAPDGKGGLARWAGAHSRQEQTLVGSLKCNFAVIALALLYPQ